MAESFRMRIIAGLRRGHKFDGPKGKSTRPTSDLVRESLFNILGPSVNGRTVVDLFAGTGALGLEALSRGADRALFVERNRENVALIHRNVARLRFEDRARVFTADAYRWTRGFAPIDGEPLLFLLDPPYREFEIQARKLNQLFAHLVETLPLGSTIAIESSGTLDSQVLPEPEAWDVRRYGSTQLAIRTLARTEDSGPPTPSSGEPRDDEP
jgi:16S rRNA (guanine966-N2)-methyltransferase